jgi:hypothetical protein
MPLKVQACKEKEVKKLDAERNNFISTITSINSHITLRYEPKIFAQFAN